MREIDYRPLVTDDPVADAEHYFSKEPEIIGYCETCGSAIYKGLDYIDIPELGVLLHDEFDCTEAWLKQFKVIG